MNILRCRNAPSSKLSSSSVQDEIEEGPALPENPAEQKFASHKPSDEGREVIDLSNAAPISSSASTVKDSKAFSASAAKSSTKSKKGFKRSAWGCLDTCCWLIGYICCLWWRLLVLYKALPSLSEAIMDLLLDMPGVRGRPISGLVVADYFIAGYFVWAVLIENLEKISYKKNFFFFAYGGNL